MASLKLFSANGKIKLVQKNSINFLSANNVQKISANKCVQKKGLVQKN